MSRLATVPIGLYWYVFIYLYFVFSNDVTFRDNKKASIIDFKYRIFDQVGILGGKSRKYSVLPFQNKQKKTKQMTIKLQYYLLPIEK